MEWIKKIGWCTIVLLAGLQAVHAQQDPQYSQYMFNQMVLNPAYAGSKEALSSSLILRNQWVGLDGAPKTITFSSHAPITVPK